MPRLVAVSILVVCISVFSSNIAPAQTTTLVLPGFATFEYQKTIKLSKSNCQNVPLEYQIDESLDIKDAAIAIQIGNVAKKALNGGAVWFGDIPGSESVGPMPLIGRITIKVCKKNWSFKSQKYLGIKAMTYDLYFGYGWYMGDGTQSKSSTVYKIKFIK